MDGVAREVTVRLRWVWHRHFSMRFSGRIANATVRANRREAPTPELAATIASALGAPESTPRMRR